MIGEDKELVSDMNDVEMSSVDSMEEVSKDNNVGGSFDIKLVKDYPKARKKVPLYVEYYRVNSFTVDQCYDFRENTQSICLSPYGIEFKTDQKYEVGDILKIDVNIPNYWNRKKKLVSYQYLENVQPVCFKILARVVSTVSTGKKFTTIVENLVIDDLDSQVLTNFIKGTL